MSSSDQHEAMMRVWGEVIPPGQDPWLDELRRLATAARTLNHLLAKTDAPIEVLTRAADELEQVAAGLAAESDGRPYFGIAESSLAGGMRSFHDFSPLAGSCNPLSPPLQLRFETDRVVGSGRFGWSYEGPPGCVHGGFVAAAFDELLGKAQSLSKQPGMTGRLTVRYRHPTPLHVELRLEGYVTEISGRKVSTYGTVHAGDTLCAEAEGLFISVDPSKFRGLMAARQAAAPDPQ